MNISDSIKKFWLSSVIAIFFATTTSLLIFARWFQKIHQPRSDYLILLVISVLLAGLLFGWIEKYVKPWLIKNSLTTLCLCILISLLFSAYLNVGLFIQPSFYLLLPRHKLEIFVLEEKNPSSSGHEVVIQGINSGTEYVSYNTIQQNGSWERINDDLHYSSDQPASLHWNGPVLNALKVYFRSQPSGGMVKVILDGQEKTVDLYSPEPINLVEIQFSIGSKVFIDLITFLIPFFTIGLLVFIPSIFLVDTRWAINKSARRSSWLLYMLPMVLGWGVYLATFFPGGISPDTISQWSQVLSGKINDWAPAIHTIIMWLLSQIWLSPAIVGIAQILSLSFVIAWGLGSLNKYGLPGWSAWLISILFALMPTHGIMVITLWKDIPYAISMLALNIVVINIIFSKGDWLKSKRHILVFGVILVGTSLFRHNGLPVAIGMALLLLIFFWKRRYAILWASLVFVLGYLGIRGPLYDILKVDRTSGTSLGNTLLLHHIAAHVQAGTYFTDEERTYLDELYPLKNGWPYDCCSVNTVYYTEKFNGSLFAKTSSKVQTIFINTILRNPFVNLKHLSCSSVMYWELPQQDCYLYTTTISGDNGEIHWIEVRNNTIGLSEASVLPFLVKPLYTLYAFVSNRNLYIFFWRPAFFMCLVFYSVLIFTIRRKKAIYLFLAAPALLQSAFGAIVNLAQDFRYQYSVVLIGVFLLSLFFFPAHEENEKS